MRKIVLFALALVILASAFVFHVSAEDSVNFPQDITYVSRAPRADGTINRTEYGSTIHEYSRDCMLSPEKRQFVSEHNEYGDSLDCEFYCCWDEHNLYMAWNVCSEVHNGIDMEKYPTEGQWGNMWLYSCVQFVISPSAPNCGEGKQTFFTMEKDYLEGGISLGSDGTIAKVIWSTPQGGEMLSGNDWDVAINRDDAKKITSYEVRIPWNKTGVDRVGNGAKFGLSYCVAAQENYNTKKGMIEWQDAILGGKNADASAVITLVGNPDIAQTDIELDVSKEKELEEGKLPAIGENDVILTLDDVDKAIRGESSTLITDASKTNGMNTRYAFAMLLAPISENKYTLVETKSGNGDDVKFDTKIEKGMIVAVFHSDDAEGSSGRERRRNALRIPVGAEITVFGVDIKNGKKIYKNACIIASVQPEETSETESEAESEPSAESSMEISDPSENVSEEASKAAEESAEDKPVSADETEITSETPETKKDSSLTWYIIGGAAVLAAAVAIFAGVKKKKSAK